MNDDTTIIRCQIPQTTSLPSVQEIIPTVNDEGMLKGLECLLLSEPMSIPITTNDNDESFLTLEQECKMDSDVFSDRPRRKTVIETNVAAVIMDDEKMEEDYPDKENMTPTLPQQQQINEIQIDKLDDDLHYISPIMSVPIER
jgi:CO dehydrogenase/acetyl-CoA synthase gamma subunit (corrinoid Fe-S protein)